MQGQCVTIKWDVVTAHRVYEHDGACHFAFEYARTVDKMRVVKFESVYVSANNVISIV